MAKHFRLFSRPIAADETPAPMSVTGVLDGYVRREAYESRLQINNSVGRCAVRVVESNLPPGSTVRVDNITKEVVVKWPAYQEVVETESLLPNGDFESGDDGTWFLGDGWSIGTGSDYDTHSGAYSARFANVSTKGSDLILVPVPAKLNDYIRVSAQVQQGGSSKGNAGARVIMTYQDAAGSQLQENAGNLVSSGKDGNWSQSTAEGAAPAGTSSVVIRVAAYRNKQNRPLWVDDLTWSHQYTVGQDTQETYFLSIAVTDSLNRVALWSGYFDDTPYDPYWAYVDTLLKFDSEATGNLPLVFENRKPGALTWQAPLLSGDSQQSGSITEETFKFGGKSLKLPDVGIPTNVRSPVGVEYFSDEDFTFECYFHMRTPRAVYQNLVNNRSSGSGMSGLSFRLSDGYLQAFHGGGADNIQSGVVCETGRWYHTALSRSGNTWRIFLDGALVASGPVFGVIDGVPPGGSGAQSDVLFLGSYGAVNNTAETLVGYMDSVRITKGFGRYTSSFTPPDRDFPER